MVGALLFVSACAQDAATVDLRENVVISRPDAEPIAPATECSVTTYREPALTRDHVDPCAELSLQSMPPTGGAHFARWAHWGMYDSPIPWGFLIHSLEHGGIVLAYDCPSGCTEVVAELEAIASERDDVVCRDEDSRARFIVVPMPELDVPVAALAWEHGYLATCLDTDSLRSFIDAHYAAAPEDLCAAGVDLSDDGWCP